MNDSKFTKKLYELDEIYHFKFVMTEEMMENVQEVDYLNSLMESTDDKKIKEECRKNIDALAEKFAKMFQEENREIIQFVSDRVDK